MFAARPCGPQRPGNILANPIPGPVDSVSQGTCSASIDERAFDLDKTHKSGMNESLVGHWVEVSGRLERETHVSLENLRELSALSFRMVPVVPPRVEAAAAPIAFAPKAEAPPEPTPVATTGTAPAGAAEDSEPASGNRIARAVYTRGRSCSSCQPALPTWVTPIEVRTLETARSLMNSLFQVHRRCRPLSAVGVLSGLGRLQSPAKFSGIREPSAPCARGVSRITAAKADCDASPNAQMTKRAAPKGCPF